MFVNCNLDSIDHLCELGQLPSAFKLVEDRQYKQADDKKSAVANSVLSEELYVILGRLNSYGTELERVEFIMEDKGLGSLPHSVPSVGSLLLFNSDINPYKDYQTLDNLISTGRSLTLQE